MDNINQYEKEYNEESLFKKLKKYGKKIGSKLVYYVLILFYTLQDPNVPVKIKATIVGSLGYFILPFDIIPDVTPGIGHVDDLNMIMVALGFVILYITPEIKEKARNKMRDIFGDDIDKEVDEFEKGLEEPQDKI